MVRLGQLGRGGQGQRFYSPKGIGVTLCANGGGRFAKTGGYYVHGVARELAPRECARMMGFPDDFILHPVKSQAQKQFGNSVVVDVIQYIGREVGVALNGHETSEEAQYTYLALLVFLEAIHAPLVSASTRAFTEALEPKLFPNADACKKALGVVEKAYPTANPTREGNVDAALLLLRQLTHQNKDAAQASIDTDLWHNLVSLKPFTAKID